MKTVTNRAVVGNARHIVNEIDSAGSQDLFGISNTTVYVGVTIFALCGPVGVLVGSQATKFFHLLESDF